MKRENESSGFFFCLRELVEAVHSPAEISVLTAQSFAEELPIELRDEMPLVRALEQRVLARLPCCREAAGPSEQPHAADFSRSHACRPLRKSS